MEIRHRFLVGALVGGALSGAVVSVGLSSWLARGAREPAASIPNEAPIVEGDDRGASTPFQLGRVVRHVDDKVVGIEQRVAALEGRTDATDQSAAPEHAALGEGPGTETTHEWFARSIERHRVEPTDPRWAPLATQELTKDLARVHQYSGVKISDVSCRNTTCLATATWPNRATAARDFESLLHTPFRVNCERAIVLPEPTEGETTISASLHLNCESWRAGGSPMVSEEAIAQLRLPPRQQAVEP